MDFSNTDSELGRVDIITKRHKEQPRIMKPPKFVDDLKVNI